MRLRSKTLLVISLTLVGLVGVLYATSSIILLRSLKQAEEQNIRQVVKGVISVLDQIQDNFSSRFTDWSSWDDTYIFIENANQKYIQSNLVPEALANLKINLVVYVNTSGKIVFGTGFDLKTQKNTPIPTLIKQHLTLNDPLLQHKSPKSIRTGIFMLSQGAMLITSQPIVKTTGTGAIGGTAIFGRYLDKNAIQNLARITQSSISSYEVGDSRSDPHKRNRQIPSELKPIFAALVAQNNPNYNSILVQPLNEDTIAGYTLINDIYGKPAILLRVNVDREIYQQGKKNLKYNIASILVVGLVFGIITLLLLERLVLSRLGHLSKEVKSIGASSDLSRRVMLNGNDELSSLSSTINGMLEALQHSQHQQQESEERYRSVIEQSSEAIFLIDADTKKLMQPNRAFQELIGYSHDEILQLTVYDLVAHDRASIDANLQFTWEHQYFIMGERNYKRKDGSLIDVEVRAKVISLSSKKVFCIIAYDITDRKRSQQALRLAEEKYRSIFENANEGIFQTTLEGRYISVNPALVRIYGYSTAEDLITNITDIASQIYVDPARRNEFIDAIAKYDAVSDFQSQVFQKNGSIIWISENARAVRDRLGKLLYYEGTVADITKRKIAEEALHHEQEQSEKLLLNILPEAIAQRLKAGQSTIADNFSEVTVLFADLVGFTQLSASIPPAELVEMLNQIFSAFDHLAETYNLEKIKTIGDAYMVVGGIPNPRTDHAEAIAEMALDMQHQISSFQAQNDIKFQIRVGINTGPVVAGVIGIKKFIYDLWGDTVNIASRMESQGIPGCIQVTETTYERLQGKYLFEKRGTISVKGKGEMNTYLLQGRIVNQKFPI